MRVRCWTSTVREAGGGVEGAGAAGARHRCQRSRRHLHRTAQWSGAAPLRLRPAPPRGPLRHRPADRRQRRHRRRPRGPARPDGLTPLPRQPVDRRDRHRSGRRRAPAGPRYRRAGGATGSPFPWARLGHPPCCGTRATRAGGRSISGRSAAAPSWPCAAARGPPPSGRTARRSPAASVEPLGDRPVPRRSGLCKEESGEQCSRGGRPTALQQWPGATVFTVPLPLGPSRRGVRISRAPGGPFGPCRARFAGRRRPHSLPTWTAGRPARRRGHTREKGRPRPVRPGGRPGSS